MPEITDPILTGQNCAKCGIAIPGDPPGSLRLCPSCAGPQKKIRARRPRVKAHRRRKYGGRRR